MNMLLASTSDLQVDNQKRVQTSSSSIPISRRMLAKKYVSEVELLNMIKVMSIINSSLSLIVDMNNHCDNIKLYEFQLVVL